MIQAIKLDDINTRQLEGCHIDFMVKNPDILGIKQINSVNEKHLTRLVGNMSDKKRQYWIDIYAQALINDSTNDSSSKSTDYEKLITEIATYITVKSTKLVKNKLNELKQQRTPFKSQYPKTALILYVVANVLTATMIWLLPKLWHELMGTSPKKDIKQPTLSNKECTRLNQITTLQQTHDKLITLQDSCTDSLFQGNLMNKKYCDEAKPMYDQLGQFISKIVEQKLTLTKRIEPLDSNELLNESMLKEQLHNKYGEKTSLSLEENPWVLCIKKVNDIFKCVNPLTDDMPTHNMDELRFFASGLSDTMRNDANSYKGSLEQITEQVERYSTLFKTFKDYLPIQAKTAKSLVEDISTKSKRLVDLSSAINYVDNIIQQAAKANVKQYPSQISVLTTPTRFVSSMIVNESTPISKTKQDNTPDTPFCLRENVLDEQKTTIDKNDITLNLPSPTNSDISFDLTSLDYKDGDGDITLQLDDIEVLRLNKSRIF